MILSNGQIRGWFAWTHDEKDFFKRLHEEGAYRLTPQEASEIEILKYQLHVRQLTKEELKRANVILDGPLVGILTL